MNQNEIVVDIFRRNNAVLTKDHFIYTSGKHGNTYINKDAIYPNVNDTKLLCRMIANEFNDCDIDVVVGPAMGGIILSQHTAVALGELRENSVVLDNVESVKSIYAEKTEVGFEFRRGYDKYLKGTRILVIEDIINTGVSVFKTIDAVTRAGGIVIGVACLCLRGAVDGNVINDTCNITLEKFYSLYNIKLDIYDELDCPMCQQNVGINTMIGKGNEYLSKKNAS